MSPIKLQKLNFTRSINRYVKDKTWISSLLAGVISWLLSIFLYSPRLTLFLGEGSGTTRRDDLLTQCLNPLTRDLNEPILAYRIVQPVLAHFFRLCGERRDLFALLGSPGIAYLALIIALACCHWALRQRFNGRISLLTTFGISTTMVTQWTNLYWGHPDSISLLAIALLLCTFRPAIVTTLVAIGSLNDERVLLALPFIATWWWPDRASWKEALSKMSPQIIAMVIGIAICLFFRITLDLGWIGEGIDKAYPVKEISGLSRIFEPKEFFSLLVMVSLGFRWLWIMPIFSLFLIGQNKINGYSVLYLASLCLTILATFTVADVSRSFAFIFPAIFIAMEIIRDNCNWSEKNLCFFLALLLSLNVFTPAATVFGVPPEWWNKNPLDWIIPYLPLPINIWQWLRVPTGASSW